jgi:hypothetical protein
VLHSAIEEVLSQKTGYSARINTFNRMSFFPNINIDIENVEFRKVMSATQETGEIVSAEFGDALMTIEKANVTVGFFDMMAGGGQLKQLEIQNLRAAAGTLLNKPLTIEKAALEEADNDKGALNITGTFDGKALNASMGFNVSGRPGNRKYDVGGERLLRVSVDGLSFDGVLHDHALSSGVEIRDAVMMLGKTKVLDGRIDFKNDPNKHMEIAGDITLYPAKSKISPDLKIDMGADEVSVTGKISSERLNLDDVSANSPTLEALNKMSALFSDGKSKDIGFENLNIDVNIDVKALNSGKIKLGSINAPLVIKDNILNIEPITGKISNGKLNGRIVLDASEETATLSQKLTVKKLNYGDLQRQFMENAEINGEADLAMNMKSKARTFDGLIKNAKGDFTFITGEGKMKSNILNLWGGGLLNTMLPKFGENKELNLNCAVIDLNLEDQTLKTNALFVDTHKITMVGEGQYKIDTDRVDMKLIPKTKDVALLDVATAVHVKGPLSDVSVTPSALDITKKVGGLLLGAVNPAFYAVTLIDLGLNENHPCKQYLIEKEELAAPEEKKTEPKAVTAERNE